MQTHPKHRSAFTLVELLVVIAIITLLAAIITPATFIVIGNTKVARMALEIASLEKALENYKLQMGEYPPDFSELAAPTLITELDKAGAAAAIINTHLQRTYRRRNIRDLPRINNASVAIHTDFLARLSPANALTFWLGGFGADPLAPLLGPGDRKPLFDFDRGRYAVLHLSEPIFQAATIDATEPSLADTLGDTIGVGIGLANDVGAQTGMITGYSPQGIGTPYVYYRADTTVSEAFAYLGAVQWVFREAMGTNSPSTWPPINGTMATTNSLAPLPSVSSVNTVTDPVNAGTQLFSFVAANKFQILATGLDNDFGVSPAPIFSPYNPDGSINLGNIRSNNGTQGAIQNKSRLPSFPAGNNYTLGQEDNVTNFSGGGTLEDSKPK